MQAQSDADEADAVSHRSKEIVYRGITKKSHYVINFQVLSRSKGFCKNVSNYDFEITPRCETEQTYKHGKINDRFWKETSMEKCLLTSYAEENLAKTNADLDRTAKHTEREETCCKNIPSNLTSERNGQDDPPYSLSHDFDLRASVPHADASPYLQYDSLEDSPSRCVSEKFTGHPVHSDEKVAEDWRHLHVSKPQDVMDPTHVSSSCATAEFKSSANPYKNSTVSYCHQTGIVSETPSYFGGMRTVNPPMFADSDFREEKEAPLMSRIPDVISECLEPVHQPKPESGKVVPFVPFDVIDSSGRAIMRSEMWRLGTFSKLSSLQVSAVRLAQSGFYYDEELDEIICYSCGLKKRQWERLERIAIVHLALSPECHHANLKDERNIPETFYPYSPCSTESSTTGEAEGPLESSAGDGASNVVTDEEPTVESSESPTGNTTLSPPVAEESRTDPQRGNVDERVTTQTTTVWGEEILQTDSAQTSVDAGRNGQPSSAEGQEEQQQNCPTAAQDAGTHLTRDASVTAPEQSDALSASRASRGDPTPPSAGPSIGGQSLNLPPPAGRAEQLQRHRQLAALSAGTAQPGETGAASLSFNSILAAVSALTGPAGKQPEPNQGGFRGAEATHPGKELARPPQNHFTPAMNTTALVYNCVQVEQARDANPYKRSGTYRSRQNGDEGETPGDGLLDMRRAASPENAMVSVRLATFIDCPSRGLPNRRVMVLAGFYYMGTGDSVRCFYCGVTLRNWREDDDPWVTHVRFRFSCDYVIAIKGDDFVFQTQMQIALGRSIINGDDSIGSTEPDAVTSSIATSSPPTSQATLPTTTSSTSTGGNASRSTATSANATSANRAAGTWPATGGRGREEPSDPESCSTAVQRAGNPAAGSGVNGTVGGVGNADRSYDTPDAATAPSPSSSAGCSPGVRRSGKQDGGKQRGGASDSPANDGGASVKAFVHSGAEVLQTDAEPGKVRVATSPLQTNQQVVAVGGQSAISRSTVSTEHPTVPNAGAAARDPDAVTSFQQLQETNRRLRRRVTCRLCGNRPVDTIFLPCGHLCTCESCAATITSCCLCRGRIRGTAHVYME